MGYNYDNDNVYGVDNDIYYPLNEKFNKLFNLCYDSKKNLIEIQNLLNTDDFYKEITNCGKIRILCVTLNFLEDLQFIDFLIDKLNIDINDFKHNIFLVKNINIFNTLIDKYIPTIDEIYENIVYFNDEQLKYLFFEKFKKNDELLLKYFNNNFIFKPISEKKFEISFNYNNNYKITKLEDCPRSISPVIWDNNIKYIIFENNIKYINDDLYIQIYSSYKRDINNEIICKPGGPVFRNSIKDIQEFLN
jgi:hypothetical protein